MMEEQCWGPGFGGAPMVCEYLLFVVTFLVSGSFFRPYLWHERRNDWLFQILKLGGKLARFTRNKHFQKRHNMNRHDVPMTCFVFTSAWGPKMVDILIFPTSSRALSGYPPNSNLASCNIHQVAEGYDSLQGLSKMSSSYGMFPSISYKFQRLWRPSTKSCASCAVEANRCRSTQPPQWWNGCWFLVGLAGAELSFFNVLFAWWYNLGVSPKT